MFTHRSGDGQSGAVHEPLGGEGAPPAFLVRAETTEDDLGSSGINCKPSRLRKKRDFAAFAIIVILGQVIISVTLKKYGWIERDINEIVSERFLPNIQQLGLEQMHTFPWSPFNDSLYEWINNQSISIGGYTSQESRPGSQLADKGARGKYPIVMIPGFVTSGLEVWGGKECAQKYFRQRMVRRYERKTFQFGS